MKVVQHTKDDYKDREKNPEYSPQSEDETPDYNPQTEEETP